MSHVKLSFANQSVFEGKSKLKLNEPHVSNTP